MKKNPPKPPPRLDKHLFEAGLQCKKRLWLDCHDPVDEPATAMRAHLAEVGAQLLEIARKAFPKGVAVEGKTLAAAVERTQQLLAEGAPVLFGATFQTAETSTRIDILVQHKDGQLDLFEIKSGTKIKQRYVTDLALQVHGVEGSGRTVRAVFLLHVQPGYQHRAETEFPPMQLLRSADVTKRVRKHTERLSQRIAQLREVLAAGAAPEVPMGSQCKTPFRCPHFDRCSTEAPPLGLHELPELNHKLEVQLRGEGIRTLREIDPQRADLSFKQRRTLAALQQGKTTIESFVRDELRDCRPPLHFLVIAAVTEPLPRFDGQRPWRHVPFGWAANTVHADGRLETAAHVHADRTDPRPQFVTTLAKHLECGGTVVCWNDRTLDDLRELLEDLPEQKVAVRTVLGRSHLDLMHLLDAGAFHPDLRGHAELPRTVAALLPECLPAVTDALEEDSLRQAVEKICAPRLRAATREKLAAELQASLQWASAALLALYRKLADVEPPKKAEPAGRPKPKALPKEPPKPLPKPLPGR